MNTNQHPEFEVFLPAIANGPTAKWAKISLIFSCFYFFPIVASIGKLGNIKIAAIVGVYVLFVFLFFQAIKHAGRTAVYPISLIGLLAVLGSSVNPGSNSLFGYGTFFSAYYFPFRRAMVLLIASLVMQFSAAFLFDLIHIYYLGPSLAVSLSLFAYGRFSRKEQIFYTQKRMKDQQIEQLAAIAERERIARDMHDLLGHSLSSLALKSELAQKLLARGDIEKAEREINDVANLARTTLSEVRYAVTGLKQKDLTSSLAELTSQLRHLGFTVVENIEKLSLDAKVESTLIMLCKEWTTNILRHSNGNTVTISLTQEDERIFLTIADNGYCKAIAPGNGIEGMKSRVAELKGTLSYSLKQGVQLHVEVPSLTTA